VYNDYLLNANTQMILTEEHDTWVTSPSTTMVRQSVPCYTLICRKEKGRDGKQGSGMWLTDLEHIRHVGSMFLKLQ
jgi:hypothetical protein